MFIDLLAYFKRVILNYGSTLLITAILASAGLLSLVWFVLGQTVAVQGAYLTIGLILALLLYWVSSSANIAPSDSQFRNFRLFKLYAVLFLIALAVIVTIDSTIIGLLVLFPPLLGLLAVQLRYQKHLYLFPFQTGAYLGLVGTSKYITTDFYFGRGDILTHLPRIQSVVETGRVSAGLELYVDFPGLHVLIASVGQVARLPSYDALVITGILAYTHVVIVVYVITRYLTDSNSFVASCISFSVVLASPVIYYMTYFFPQSFATVLIILLIFVSVRLANAPKQLRRRFVPVGLVFGLTLVFTHHLTIFIFVPLLATVAISYYVGDLWGLSEGRTPFSPFLGFVLLIGVIYYWFFYSDWFVPTLFTVLFAIVAKTSQLSGSVSDTGGVFLYTYTTPNWMDPVYQSVTGLFSPLGIYFSILLAVFVLGLFHVLEAPWARKLTGFLVAGFLAAIIVFPNPITIAIKSIVRARFAWMFVFIFVIGAGIARLSNQTDKRHKDVLLICFVILLGVTAAFAAADHIQVYDTPQDQSEMSTREFQSHETTSSYIETGSSYNNVTALWLSSVTLNLFSDNAEPRAIQAGAEPIEEGIIVDDGLFVYRQQWSEYYVAETSSDLRLNRIVISDQWLHHTVNTEHKVYATGEVGIVWSSEQRVFGPGEDEVPARNN